MSDLALGAIVLVIAAMPVALGLLALFDVVRIGERTRRLWLRAALALLLLPAVAWFGMSVWGWAGAAHLEPLCAAYATPEFPGRAAPGTRSLLLESADGSPAPDWLPALLQAPASLQFIEREDGRGAVVQSAYALQVRRITHHRNRWFEVEMERLRVVDRTWDVTVAEGDELTLRAGRRTWHCGVASGRDVTAPRSAAERGLGYARFIARALRGATASATTATRETIAAEPRSMP